MDNVFNLMDENMDNRLKMLRLHLNQTQQQMADVLGISQNSYSRIENGVTSFKDGYKEKLEDKYHLTKGWLSGADVPMFEKGDPIAGLWDKSISRSNREKLKEQILNELVDERLNYQENQVTISREVFDQISRLTETVLSQQKTIEALREECKKMRAQMGGTATCALASGSDISTIDIKSSNVK